MIKHLLLAAFLIAILPLLALTALSALTAIDGTHIVQVDADGEVITGLIFANNYFELQVDGVAVGKDKVPFTPFNSSIVRFRVRRPFAIAMLLVDWEEHLGVGCEANAGKAYHAGDGGMVAVFKDASNVTDGTQLRDVTIYNMLGVAVYQGNDVVDPISVVGLPSGIDIMDLQLYNSHVVSKTIIP